MEAVHKLFEMGYVLSVRNGNISFSFIGDNEPPQEKVMPLLNELKEYKNEAIEYIQRTDILNNTKSEYGVFHDNIRKAGTLRSYITKGILSGEDSYTLLLSAIECISLMTGDKLFYNHNKANIIAVHGLGLLESVPIEIELEETNKRLDLLLRPELMENEAEDSKKRILQAIKEHKQRAKKLRSAVDCKGYKDKVAQQRN